MKTTEETLPSQEELKELIREGDALLAGQIHVTFQQSDIDQADSYGSNTNCYLCVALRRMGHEVTSAAGTYVRLTSSDDIWDFETGHSASPEMHEYSSIVGKTLTLTRRAND